MGFSLSQTLGLGGNDAPRQLTPLNQYTADDWIDTAHNTPEYYETIKQYDPKVIAAKKAEEEAATAQQIGTAGASNPVAAYSGPTAEAKLQQLLPQGFENTLIPSSAADPYIASTMGKARGSAQDLIETMLKRGTINPTGKANALTALTGQDPGVTSKLRSISDVLLANERSKLRGIANQGFGAAAGQSGETFDPNPYKGQVDAEAQQFLSAFPTSYTTAVGDTGGLYDTSGLSNAAGAVTGSRSVSYDPYAVEGGKLSTGLDEGAPPPPAKKRSTAVF